MMLSLTGAAQRKFSRGVDDNFEKVHPNPYLPLPEELPQQALIVELIVKQSYTLKGVHTLPVAILEVITVEDSNSTRLLETGVVIGCALRKCCVDPSICPVVRVMISKAGALIAYIPGKYFKRNLTKGDAQIVMADVESTPELEKVFNW
jgi:hypothetical protein